MYGTERHNVTVVDENNRVIKHKSLDDYYCEEALAERRAANKLKYAPKTSEVKINHTAELAGQSKSPEASPGLDEMF